MKRWLNFLVPVTIVAALASLPALADVYIHMKDGRTIIVPVDRNAIDRVEIVPNGAEPADEDARQEARERASRDAREPREENKADEDEKPSGLPKGGSFRQNQVARSQGPQTYRVGPDQPYKRVSDLATIARDGDTIEIEAGLYVDDFARWEQNNLTLKGVGGLAHLKGTQEIDNHKAIWIIKGDNVTVENIEFSGARVRGLNGAGIRAEGGKLTIRNSVFHDNEFGILSDNSERGDIDIENSEFYHQHREGTFAHNIYIGHAAKFRLVGNYVHGAVLGHQVKSRARENYIAYNRLMDEKGGNGSYSIDLPNCGTAYIIGNVMQQSRDSDNYTAISYGAEGCDPDRPRNAYVVNNTFINDAPIGTFITNHVDDPVLARNNLIVGIAKLSSGPVKDDNNLLELRESFANRAKFDYHLTKSSSAIDKAIAPGKADTGVSLVPELEYKHPHATMKRPKVGKLDMGAFEYAP
jgi:hypothetical protein